MQCVRSRGPVDVEPDERGAVAVVAELAEARFAPTGRVSHRIHGVGVCEYVRLRHEDRVFDHAAQFGGGLLRDDVADYEVSVVLILSGLLGRKRPFLHKRNLPWSGSRLTLDAGEADALDEGAPGKEKDNGHGQGEVR